MKNPIQPLMKDANGVVRFKENDIVQHLLDTHPTYDMNHLARMGFTDDDLQQFAQLIGYSLSDYGDLSYVGDRAYATAAEPNPNWCVGCSPDNCSGCGGEPVESEPAMLVMKHIRSGDLAQAKPNQKALHPYMLSDAFPRYTTPQPDRVAELEAETTKLKLDLLTSYGEAEELSGKVAELEKALQVARDGIDEFLVANDPTEFGCACDLSVGYLCGPCHADKQQQPLKSALAKINEVLGDEL